MLKIDSPDYQILFLEEQKEVLENILSRFSKSQKFMVILDENIKNLYWNQFKDQFSLLQAAKEPQSQQQLFHFQIKSGELNKSLENIELVHEEMFKLGFSRQDVIIGFGGGLVTDFSGFAASMYMRGIPSVYLPTSVLAISDAAVGSKTAVNNQFGKNLIGAFYDPSLIIVNVQYLKSLDDRNFSNGLVEIIKIAMIQDRNLFYKLLSFQKLQDLKNDVEELKFVMMRSMQLKLNVVNCDKREADLRKILNFGHTLGHGIEHVSKESILHGEAVAMGILFALKLSEHVGVLEGNYEEIVKETKQIFDTFNIPYAVPQNLDKEQILKYMFLDKKVMKNTLHFVLLKQIGESCAKTYPIEKQLVQNLISDRIIVQYSEKSNKNQQIQTVQIPGSKSITNRVLIMVALACEKVRINNILFSEDTEIMLKALCQIGALKILERGSNFVTVQGMKVEQKYQEIVDIYVGNSGTTARFLICFLLALNTKQKYKIYGIQRMNQRPIRDLLISLILNNNKEKGEDVFQFLEQQYCFPLILNSRGLKGGQMFMNSQKSSQYVTSLLLAAPYAEEPILLNLAKQTENSKLVSEEFILMTTQLMQNCGIETKRKDVGQFEIPNTANYTFLNGEFNVEPDGAAMSYYFQAGLMLQKSFQIDNFSYEDSRQGDVRFLEKLREIGVEIDIKQDKIVFDWERNKIQRIEVFIMEKYKDQDVVEFDFNDYTDCFITFASILGCLNVDKSFYIKNIANQAVKECNRLYGVSRNLLSFGVMCLVQTDGIIIKCIQQRNQNELNKEILIKCYNDHRMAMAFSIHAAFETKKKEARSNNIQYIFDNKNCVQKTFPEFWTLFDKYFGVSATSYCQKKDDSLISQQEAIFLVGMRGAGKSSLGKQMEDHFGLRVLCMDNLIFEKIKGDYAANISNLGEGIKEIGWKKFRDIESEILQEIIQDLWKYQNCVIITGGGVVEREENLWLLKQIQNVVWIQRNIDEIEEFLDNKCKERPKLPNEMGIKEVYTKIRREKYEFCSDLIFSICEKNSEISNEKLYWESVNAHFRKFCKSMIFNKNNLQNNSQKQNLIYYKQESFFVCLQVEDILKLEQQKLCYVNKEYNALEVRADQYFQTELEKQGEACLGLICEAFLRKIAYIQQFVSIPLIFTLRSIQEGGVFDKIKYKETVYSSIIKYVLKSLQFQFVDIEFSDSNYQVQLLRSIQKKYKNSINVIYSKHYLQNLEDEEVIKHTEIMKTQSNLFDIMKICLNAEHRDTLLQKIQKSSEKQQLPLIIIKLGKSGVLSRIQNPILTPVCDSKLSDQAVIKGQLEKSQILNWKQQLGLNFQKPRVVYLFGTDIKLSYSPMIHNLAYEFLGVQNDVYFKNQQIKSVEEILEFMKKPEFLGAAVTMPFKQDIFPYLDVIHGDANQIQAVNTILRQKTSQGNFCFHGFNTDIYGIMKPIQKKMMMNRIPSAVQRVPGSLQKIALLIGSGATASTAAFALQSLKMKVLVWNRNKDNLSKFVKQNQQYMNIQGFESFEEVSKYLNEKQENLDLIISTIPGKSDIGIQNQERLFKGDPYVFDISYFPRVSKFQESAKQFVKNEEKYIQGIDMLLYQAFKQIEIFTGFQPIQKGLLKTTVKSKYFKDQYLI